VIERLTTASLSKIKHAMCRRTVASIWAASGFGALVRDHRKPTKNQQLPRILPVFLGAMN
jgi:hypothetical protein